jgi:hypothetical protein
LLTEGGGPAGKKPKKKNTLIKKLNALTEETKQGAITAYINRCKKRHFFRMLEWKYQQLPEDCDIMVRLCVTVGSHQVGDESPPGS